MVRKKVMTVMTLKAQDEVNTVRLTEWRREYTTSTRERRVTGRFVLSSVRPLDVLYSTICVEWIYMVISVLG